MTAVFYEHFTTAHHQALITWHQSLYQFKGERATLRRCTTPDEVLLTKGFSHVLHSLGGFKSLTETQLLALACTVGVLAHIKEHDDNRLSFAEQMATAKAGSDKPLISELRLSQLQKSYNWQEFYRGMIRTTKILGKNLNIISIADAIFHWGKEFNGDYATQPMKRLQVRWANDYYRVLLNDSKDKDE